MKPCASTSLFRAKAQRGAVLATSLILLLVMTLIGITAMRSTSLEEKMSGNTLSRDMAFQSAESGLRAGENLLYTMRSSNTGLLTTFDGSCTNGLCDISTNVTCTDTSSDSSWLTCTGGICVHNSTVRKLTGASTLNTLNPGYRVQQINYQESLEAGVQFPRPYYALYSRAVGGTNDAVVCLQSMYKIH